MRQIEVKLRGTCDLLMRADTLADPLHKANIAHNKVLRKRAKTRDDLIFLAESEWKNSLYLGEDGRIVIPALNVRACLISGAKLKNLDMAVKRGCFFDMRDIPLRYDGPADIQEMWESGDFVDLRSVRVSTLKLMRYRPKFFPWGIDFSVDYNPEIISDHDIQMCFENAGLYVGLGDFRPVFGRFSCGFWISNKEGVDVL